MESNTPPQDNQSSPNNILSPPFIRYNPSDVRVVSQSQSRIRSHSESHHSEDYQLDRLVEDAANHDFVTQTPMRRSCEKLPRRARVWGRSMRSLGTDPMKFWRSLSQLSFLLQVEIFLRRLCFH